MSVRCAPPDTPQIKNQHGHVARRQHPNPPAPAAGALGLGPVGLGAALGPADAGGGGGQAELPGGAAGPRHVPAAERDVPVLVLPALEGLHDARRGAGQGRHARAGARRRVLRAALHHLGQPHAPEQEFFGGFNVRRGEDGHSREGAFNGWCCFVVDADAPATTTHHPTNRTTFVQNTHSTKTAPSSPPRRSRTSSRACHGTSSSSSAATPSCAP